METIGLEGSENWKPIQIMKSGGMTRLFLKGQAYMSWTAMDELAERVAIVQLYEQGLGTQEELSETFEVHVNTVSKYVTRFREEGTEGLKNELRGPREKWKIRPEVRAKILRIVLEERIREYTSIQERVERRWDEKISVWSIRQVLLENGLIEERINSQGEQRELSYEAEKGQTELTWGGAEDLTEEKVSPEGLGDLKPAGLSESISGESSGLEGISGEESALMGHLPETDSEGIQRNRESSSRAKRIYWDGLERGLWSAYAGGLLFAPLIERHHFLEMIQGVIDIPTHEGYSLSQLSLTLFYFDLFEFRSIEDFKTVYPEEYGPLIGRANSPSIYTLRRFLHRVRKLKKGNALIEAFGKEYLKSGLVRWGTLYIDSHFLPYYGMRVITKGWHGVQDKVLKGSYQFLGIDEDFNPLLFLLRPSSDDLLEMIPELIETARRLAREVGMNADDLTVVFDREGYSAEFFRKLGGMQPKVKFITWAKYMDQWVGDYTDEQLDQRATIHYEIQDEEKIRYCETKKTMNKYGPIRAFVIESRRKSQRSAIYTNDEESGAERIIERMCRRWGQETLNKTFKWDHKMDYFPGYVSEELEEQPLVKNPELKELKRRKAQEVGKLNERRIEFAKKAFSATPEDVNWKEVKERNRDLCAEMNSLQAKITLLELEIDKFPKEVRFDQAHEGKELVELDYEKKRFLDCIKVFTYMMEKKMCSLLSKYYDDPKDIYVILSMIIRRGGEIKLEGSRLMVRLKGFKNPEVEFAARRLCEDLNQMQPCTLGKDRFPIHYAVA